MFTNQVFQVQTSILLQWSRLVRQTSFSNVLFKKPFSTTCALCGKTRRMQKKSEISEKKLTRYFVDYRRVRFVAGSGGKGACTFHSEPRKEWGGPDGGNGGDGGSITLKADQHASEMDDENDRKSRALWDYLSLNQPLEKSDVIIGLGCHDVRVAERSAELFLEGLAPWLLFTGYLGNQTAGAWTRPEAEVFLDIALNMGVPRRSILLETVATNTGENIRFSYQVLKDSNVPVSKLILVQQPFMERRVMATFLHQWPEPKGHTCAVITSPRSDMASYPNASVGSKHDLICYMLGVLERIRDYPQRGYQVKQDISSEAMLAYQWFLQAGYRPQ
ncbi:uncharacterized protein SCO4629 isoform X2 [Clupea harengus]|uniref:Uncharacterized protein SCO4629 isoform X2 n=1 Tax=Clupea harengus TaxID=7950 RepID=A0A6P8FF54_CLUHA|nr:uncharacterized protein SCO4629 isoform X2 [Clupea harengus]